MFSLQITTLVENHSNRDDLVAEHGLSFWIEADEFRFLFDTGTTRAFLNNAERLGISLADAEAVVLSHGHYDHTGGLAFLTDALTPRRLYLGPSGECERWSQKTQPPHGFAGMPAASKTLLAQLGDRVFRTTSVTMLGEDIGITGPIPRVTDFEDVGGRFFLDAECTVPDTLPDDQAVWVKTPNGVVVLFGCAHAGTVNTLLHLENVLGVKSVYAVVGGLHLRNASDERINRTAEALNRFGVQRLIVGHCTGKHAFKQLAESFQGKAEELSSGLMMSF